MKIINLLPKPRQKDLYYEEIYHGMVVLFVISVISFAFVFAAQVAVKFFLQEQSVGIQRNVDVIKSQVSKDDNIKIKQTIKDVNTAVSDFNSLAANSPKWSKFVKAFVALPPDGIKISQLNADIAKKTVTINGYSPSRELVIKMYENIKQDTKNFYNVDYPLENVVKAKDVNFHFTFYIKDELLK